jgi:hypothetical protein
MPSLNESMLAKKGSYKPNQSKTFIPMKITMVLWTSRSADTGKGKAQLAGSNELAQHVALDHLQITTPY